MQLNELKQTHKSRKGQRIGRGGKRGTYSGRGVKGQKSRAGRKMMPMIREIIKRYPKLRGYRYGGIPGNLVAVNVDVLERRFEAGETVNVKSLLEKGIISNIEGKAPTAKILSRGELKKALTIENCKVSKGAQTKIEKAGGKVELFEATAKTVKKK